MGSWVWLRSKSQHPEPESVASIKVSRTIWDSLGKQRHLQTAGRYDAGTIKVIFMAGSGRPQNFSCLTKYTLSYWDLNFWYSQWREIKIFEGLQTEVLSTWVDRSWKTLGSHRCFWTIWQVDNTEALNPFH